MNKAEKVEGCNDNPFNIDLTILTHLKKVAVVVEIARTISAQFAHYEQERGGVNDSFIDPFTRKVRENGVTINVASLRALNTALKDLT